MSEKRKDLRVKKVKKVLAKEFFAASTLKTPQPTLNKILKIVSKLSNMRKKFTSFTKTKAELTTLE